MTTLVLGTNRFEDCEHILARQGTPILSAVIRGGQPVVNLTLERGPTGQSIRVRDNRVMEGPLTVDSTREGRVTFRMGESTIVSAHVQNQNTLCVEVDFRALGLNIYTDGSALHVGGATLSGNVVRGGRTAINVG